MRYSYVLRDYLSNNLCYVWVKGVEDEREGNTFHSH